MNVLGMNSAIYNRKLKISFLTLFLLSNYVLRYLIDLQLKFLIKLLEIQRTHYVFVFFTLQKTK